VQSTRAAEVEIRRDILEGEKSSSEIAESQRRLISQQPSLEIEFAEVAEHHFPGEGVRLGVSVNLRNSGLRNLSVAFDRSSFSVGRLDPGDERAKKLLDIYRAAPQYLPPGTSKLAQMPNRVFRAGQQRQLTFVAPAEKPGWYFVQFDAVYAAMPFEGEQDFDQESWIVQAVQQLVVAVTPSPAAAQPATREERGAARS
jgi:hypothetical protein